MGKCAKSRCQLLSSVHDRTIALRVVAAYRTISGPVVQIISDSIPIHLLAFERKKLWALRNEGMEEEVSKLVPREIKDETLRL